MKKAEWSVGDFGFVMSMFTALRRYIVIFLCFVYSAAACEFSASLHVSLVRAHHEECRLRENRCVNDLTLFSGIMLHAMNILSGDEGSILRESFVPLLCDAMEHYIEETYEAACASSHIEASCAFIRHIKLVARKLPKRHEWDVKRVSEDVRRGYEVLIECFGADRCCLEYERSFKIATFCCDPVLEEESGLRVSSLSAELASHVDILGLQQRLYKEAAKSRCGSEILKVHHQVISLLGKMHGRDAGGVGRCCIMVDFATSSPSPDFFTSPEYRECLFSWASSRMIDGDESFLCSVAEIRRMCRDRNAMEQKALKQDGLLKKYPATFMGAILEAFRRFQRRLEVGKERESR